MNRATAPTAATETPATTTFSARGGGKIAVPERALASLRSDLVGDSLVPGEAEYEGARTVWNAMVDRRPSLLARCDGAPDVQRCVTFALEHGVLLTVRGGGHHIAGSAVADGALTIDFSTRRGVEVDSENRVVTVEPGATLADLDAATQAHGLVVPSGIVSETGVAGLALGGGFGWMSRRWGLTCDHLVEAEMVDGRGERLLVTEQDHPELWWALRGGGGGVGVVTRFRFRARPLSGPVTAGPIVRESLEEAFALYRRRTADGPEELGCLLKLAPAPPAPFLPESVHGRPVAFTVPCHSGDSGSAGPVLEPLRGGSSPLADLAEPRPFTEFQSMFDGGEPKGRRNYWKSEYVSVVGPELESILIDAAQRLPAASSNIKAFWLGGAVCRQPAERTSAGHRDARFIVVIATAWEDADRDEENVAWVRETWRRVHDLSGRGGYVNFLTEDVAADEQRSAHGGVDVDRLEEIRRRVDPDGLFSSRSRG